MAITSYRQYVTDPMFGTAVQGILDLLVDPKGQIFEPTRHQVPLLSCQAQNQVWLMGRRSGKSTAAAVRAIIELIKPNRRVWVIAPTYDLTEKIYRQIHYYMTRCLRFLLDGEPKYSRNGMSLKLITGSELVCKSTERPDQLVGESLDLVIADEAGAIDDYAIELMTPALTDINPLTGRAKGTFIAVGTPRTHNWFKDMYDRGIMSREEQMEEFGQIAYASYITNSFSNPHIDHAAIALDIKRKPINIGRQEYYAEWQKEGGQVFRMRETNWYPVGFRSREAGETAFIGIDIGKTNDFTVVSGLNRRLEQIGFLRLNQTDWSVIKNEIKREIYEYSLNGPVVACIDESGSGSPVYEEVKDYFADSSMVQLVPVNFSRGAKVKINVVEDLCGAISDGLVKLYDIKEQRQEFADFGYTLDTKGNPVYSAPSKKHDDIVTANGLALAATTFGTARFKEFLTK